MIPDTPVSIVLESEMDDPSVLSAFSDEELLVADSRGRTVLHAAAHKGHAQTLVALVEKFRGMIHKSDSLGNTPAHYAAGAPWESD
jgi:ankyrin repeat protein